MLGSAERPMIVVGGGAQGAGEHVARIAEMLDAPVMTGRMGQGVIDGRHRLSVTAPAGYRFWGEADVVLAVGTRLQPQQQNWGVDPSLKIIRIDVDKTDGDKNYAVPADNPFWKTEGARPEIWAFGLRNPWRMTYDAASDQLWVGNNGQDLTQIAGSGFTHVLYTLAVPVKLTKSVTWTSYVALNHGEKLRTQINAQQNELYWGTKLSFAF